MESLVFYKKLLLRKHAATLGEDGEASLRTECLDLLRQLQTIDSYRKQRYADLGNCTLFIHGVRV